MDGFGAFMPGEASRVFHRFLEFRSIGAVGHHVELVWCLVNSFTHWLDSRGGKGANLESVDSATLRQDCKE